jgi:GAF domain-containing protein
MHLPNSESLPTDKAALYRRVHADIVAIMTGEKDFIANAPTAALLFNRFPTSTGPTSLLKGTDLVLGPFRASPPVFVLPRSRYLRRAAASQEALIVPNVHDFPGHIACMVLRTRKSSSPW